MSQRSSEHSSSLAILREELSALRREGRISHKLVDWHERLATCAEAITRDIPTCAGLCAELMSIDFEIPPELAAKVAEELSDDPRVIVAGSENFFRKKCGEADEILHTLIIALGQADR
jgi:hypothetical protein